MKNFGELFNNLVSLENTPDVPANYAENMIRQRVAGDPMAKGSIFEGYTLESLKETLFEADWQEVNSDKVHAPCRCFMTRNVPGGLYGVMPLTNLPDDVRLVVKDNKNTGFVSLCVEGGERIPAEEVYMITCPVGDKEVVTTFHPGAPSDRPTTPTEAIPVGTVLTKKEALELGFNSANVL